MPSKNADRYSVQTEDSLPPTLPTGKDIYQGRQPGPASFIPPGRGGAILKDGQLSVGGFTLTETGLKISDNATQDDWAKVGELLFRLEGSIQWLIGDWLVYGDDVKWGDIPSIAASLGRDPKTLYNYCNYSRAIQSSLRREDLSYTHHMLVVGLSDEHKEIALSHAAAHNLSVSAFRQWIREQQGKAAKYELPAGDDFTSLWREVERFVDVDPETLKPGKREAARNAIQNYLREFERQAERAQQLRKRWGIE